MAEISISVLVSNRNLSYHSLEYLIPVFKNVIHDSAIMSNLSLYPAKAKHIIKDIIVPEHQHQLVNVLTNQKFGGIIDESTDISVHNAMVITVKYEDDHLLRINETTWDILKVYGYMQCYGQRKSFYFKTFTRRISADRDCEMLLLYLSVERKICMECFS